MLGDGERLFVDEFYEGILGDVFRDARVRAKRLRNLYIIVCAESRIDMSVLADLTDTGRDTVKRVVESLHAVLVVSPKDGYVYWYTFRLLTFSSPGGGRGSAFLSPETLQKPTRARV
jgi:hypothetical protein